MVGNVTVEPLGEFAYIVRGLHEPWRWSVRHPAVTEVAATSDCLVVIVTEPVDVVKFLTQLAPEVNPRQVVVPMKYDGADIDELSDLLDIDVAAVHQSSRYVCDFLGFLPGFPYLSGLPDSLAGLPRRASPRAQVPTGSIAIAGSRCGIYPQSSPGGWWLIGQTPIEICDVTRDFFLIQPGDEVIFEAI
jgi:KipI family sensor histidine kinase inhibitor